MDLLVNYETLLLRDDVQINLRAISEDYGDNDDVNNSSQSVYICPMEIRNLFYWLRLEKSALSLGGGWIMKSIWNNGTL